MAHINNYKECKGYKAIQFSKGGYKHLIDLLISKHEETFYSKLSLNHKLEKIHLLDSGENKVLLKFENGRQVRCDRVLCTMSLGCLKENIETLIEPRHLVPIDKFEAIKNHGYGTVNKVNICIYT